MSRSVASGGNPAAPPPPGGATVPRIPRGRRTRGLLVRASFLVPAVAVGAALGTWLVVAGGGELVVVPLLVAGVPFGCYLQARDNTSRELAWDGRVLAGRTALGWQGVEPARVQAVRVSAGETGPPTRLVLADGDGHVEATWAALTELPGAGQVREVLLARQQQGLVLPAALCRAWQVPCPPGTPVTGTIPAHLRPPSDRTVDLVVGILCLLAAAAGIAVGATI